MITFIHLGIISIKPQIRRIITRDTSLYLQCHYYVYYLNIIFQVYVVHLFKKINDDSIFDVPVIVETDYVMFIQPIGPLLT